MPSLQKSNLVSPSIASVGSPTAGPDTTTGDAIKAIGGATRDFLEKKAKNKFSEKLEGLADDVVSVKFGEELEKTNERFNRLAAARDQGVLDDTMIKIEAESLLKESIESFPMFGPELRRTAAEKLGYDPTGSQIRAKLAIPKVKEDPLVSEARSLANATGGDFNEILSILGDASLATRKAELVTANAKIGAGSAREILSATLEESQGRYADLVGNLLVQIKNGGVKDEAQTQAIISTMSSNHKTAFLNRLNAAGIDLDPSQVTSHLSAIDARWDNAREIAQQGALTSILNENLEAITSLMAIREWDLFGPVKFINNTAGQEGVKNFFRYNEKYKNPAEIALLRQTNPELGILIDNLGDIRIGVAEVYKNITGADPTFSNNTLGKFSMTPEQEDALTDKVFPDLVLDTNLTEEQKDGRGQFAQIRAEGKKWKVLGAYMQKGARQNVTDEEQEWVVAKFESEYEPIISRFATTLVDRSINNIQQGTGTPLQLEMKGGKLVFKEDDPFAAFGAGLSGRTNQEIAITKEMRGDLIRLNALIQGARNGWADDFGVNSATFALDTLNKINSVKDQVDANNKEVLSLVDKYAETGDESILDQIKTINPNLFEEAEKRAALISTSSTDGGNGSE